MGIFDKALALVRREEKGLKFDARGAGAYGGWWDNFDSAIRRALRPTRMELDYSAVDPRKSSVFDACLKSYASAMSEPELVVQRETVNGPEQFPEHPALALLEKPNPFYALSALWRNTLSDYWAYGNAYWLCELDMTGTPMSIWAAQCLTIRPRWPEDGSKWIGWWERYREGAWEKINPLSCAVLHFRADGFDWGPNSLGRLGESPVQACLSDLFTDDETTAFVATVLKNLGVPGAIFNPRNPEVLISKDQRNDLKAQYEELTTGKNRGRSIIFDVAMDLQRLGFSPSEVDFKEVMMQCESRIAACMNVPAAIAGLRVGMEAASQRANFEAANQQFWQNGVVPLLSNFADVLTNQFLVLFPGTEGLKLEFDLDGIQALSEDVNELHRRIRLDFRGDLITRNEARVQMGVDALMGTDEAEFGDVFFSEISGATGNTPAPGEVETDATAKQLGTKLSNDPLLREDAELALALWHEETDKRHRALLEAEAV